MAPRSLFSPRSSRCSVRACFGPCFVSTLLWLVLVLAPGPDEDRQRSPPAPRRRIGEAAFHVVHVCVATDQLLPVGLLAVVNSTLHHSCNRSALVFHVVVPPALVARTRILESLFPAARFSIFGMAVNGVAAKLRGRLRALRAGAGAGRDAGRLHGQASAAAAGGGATGGGDGGADDDGGNRQASDESGEAAATAATEAHLYRWAVAYLPALFPQLRRVIWLHEDALVQGDLAQLWHTPLGGQPVAAVPDCSRRLEDVVNTTALRGLSTTVANEVHGCPPNLGVLVVDLVQWQALDTTARVEYFAALYSRTPRDAGALYESALDPLAPVALALRRSFAWLEPQWNLFGLGRTRFEADEVMYWSRVWKRRGIADPAAGAASPARSLLTRLTTPRILQFSGGAKPWAVAEGCRTGARSRRCARGAGGALCARRGTGELESCAELWWPYVEHGLNFLQWDGKWDGAELSHPHPPPPPGGALQGRHTKKAFKQGSANKDKRREARSGGNPLFEGRGRS